MGFNAGFLRAVARRETILLLGGLLLLLNVFVHLGPSFQKPAKEPPPPKREERRTIDPNICRPPYYYPDWNNHSRLRVLYINGHEGTENDMISVAIRAGFNLACTKMQLFSGYGWHADEWTRKAYQRALAGVFCDAHDIFIIGDAVTDFQLLSGRDCNKTVIVQPTNRFDFGYFREPNYLARFQEFIDRPNVYIAANNPYEEWYMSQRGVLIHRKRFTVIRPMGALSPGQIAYFAPNVPRREIPMLAIDFYPQKPWWPSLEARMQQAGVRYVRLRHRGYGGPEGLSKYKAIIVIPYQVSIMAFYEGLSFGVRYFVPTEAFMRELVRTYDIEFPWPREKGTTVDCLHPGFPWDKAEWWSPYFRPFLMYFSSWEDLANQFASLPSDDSDVRQRQMDFAARRQAEVARTWAEFLEKANRRDTVRSWNVKNSSMKGFGGGTRQLGQQPMDNSV